VACIGEEARRRPSGAAAAESNAKYFYLLGRVYELLGYCARHTPWLSNSPKFYWQKAVVFFEQAARFAIADSDQRAFLEGKVSLRNAMIFTLDLTGDRTGDSHELLTAAERFFADADWKEQDPRLQFIYRDASVIANTEARQRTLRQEIRTLINRARDRTWPAILGQISEKVTAFPALAFVDLPSSRSAMASPAQDSLAKARKLYAQAHTLEDFVKFLRSAPSEHINVTQDLIATSEEKIRACYDESAELCDNAGLSVRAAHTRVTKLRRMADAALRECVHQFKSVRGDEGVERAELLKRTIAPSRSLSDGTLSFLAGIGSQSSTRVTAEFLEAFTAAGMRLSDNAMVFKESDDTWVVSDGFDRYLVQKRHGTEAQVIDLAKQPIPFNPREAQIFDSFSRAITNTCEVYTKAVHEIYGALKAASALYDRMTIQLAQDQGAVRDTDLISLYVTTHSILQELQSHHYPLLATLRDRTRYAWSLLEMFQMRHG